MKFSGEKVILRGIVPVVSGFPKHFMFYSGNLVCFSNSAFWTFQYKSYSVLCICMIRNNPTNCWFCDTISKYQNIVWKQNDNISSTDIVELFNLHLCVRYKMWIFYFHLPQVIHVCTVVHCTVQFCNRRIFLKIFYL